jgi:chromosome segregation ATPase
MDFHDYAAQETSGLLARLVANRSDASTEQLRIVRDALEAATHALAAPPPVDDEIRDLVARLAHAAAEQVRRVGDEAHTTLTALRGELETHRTVSERLSASLAQSEAVICTLRTELDNERERAAASDRDLAVTVEAHTEIEAACRQAEAACRHETQAKAAVEQNLRESQGLLDLALGETAQLQAQVGQHSGEVERLRGELAGLRSAHEELETARQALESERHHEAASRSAAEAELREVRGLLDIALADAVRLGGELEQQTADSVTLRAELAKARDAGAERDAIRAQRDSMAVERDAVVTQLEASSGRVHALESSQGQHEETIRQLEIALEHGRESETRFLGQIVSAEQETTGARAEAEALRRDVARSAALLDSAVLVVDELASVSTAPDLLSTLVHGLSVEFPRVALFLVKGTRLEGELQVGFGKTTDVSELVFPLTSDSPLTRAASSGVVTRLTAGELAGPGAPFGGMPSAALVLPIVLQEKPLAVVYAEESDRGSGSQTSSLGFAKLLVSQTVVLLMRHTLEIKTLDELREYAAMLLHEAEEMYTADSEAGRSDKELRARLKGNLDCATQLYAHRATLEGPAAAMLLEERIATAIGAATPFAKDLAAVVARPEAKRARREAKVS